MSLWPLAAAALVALGAGLIGYRALGRWLIEQRAVRLRAQARPVIDRRLEHLDGQVELEHLAQILAMDLASRETSALVYGAHGKVLAEAAAEDDPGAPPLLDTEAYERALGGDPHVTRLVAGAGGRHALAALIPPRGWLPNPPAVIQLTSDLSEEERRLDRLALALGGGLLACMWLATGLEIGLGGAWPLLAVVGLLPLAAFAAKAGAGGVELSRGTVSARGTGQSPGSERRADFTETMRRVEAAFLAREASEERMRTFIADASHELRTPLTSLSGAAEVLVRGAKDDPRQVERVAAVIRSQAERMGALVSDMLSLARLDAEIGPRDERVFIGRLLTEHAEELRIAHPDRQVSVSSAEGIVVAGDSERLRQALQNLTANAVRHTAQGGHIELEARHSGDEVAIIICDDGEGIEPADLPRVFERFYRCDRARSADGTGLGLAIVRETLHSHGGDVSVVSLPGEGARFTLRLPALRG